MSQDKINIEDNLKRDSSDLTVCNETDNLIQIPTTQSLNYIVSARLYLHSKAIETLSMIYGYIVGHFTETIKCSDISSYLTTYSFN